MSLVTCLIKAIAHVGMPLTRILKLTIILFAFHLITYRGYENMAFETPSKSERISKFPGNVQSYDGVNIF